MRYRILPYRQGSKGAKALAEELGGKVLKLVNSSFKCNYDDLVINWGHSDCADLVDKMTSHLEYPDNTKMLNWMPQVLRNASNKLKFFELVKELGVTPRFWTDREDIPDDAFPIVCRTVLAGHSGAGIVIAQCRGDLVDAPLYVQYVKKKDEYRIHIGRRQVATVCDGVGSTATSTDIIAMQRKAVPTGTVPTNWQVRNHDNGFIYKREGVNPPPSVLDGARRAFEATGLDFGAVDVIYNQQQERAYVLEINTAPGLEGQTVADYATFFRGVSV